MKDMPIGKLMEAVKTGNATIKYEVEIERAILWTCDESAFVHISDTIGETHVDNRALADAIRERCAG